MLPCDEVRDNLAAYGDGALDAGAREGVRLHLAGCAACAAEARGQGAVRDRLRALKRQDPPPPLPARVWDGAVAAWDRRDALSRRRVAFRWAAAGACLLLLTINLVWARRASRSAFPVAAALADFHTALDRTPAPAFPTADPDAAARWLRARLGEPGIPALDLSLSHARLLGADVLPGVAPPTGRLLYSTPRGVVAVYVAPGRFGFPGGSPVTAEGRTFRAVRQERAELRGWRGGDVGFCLAAAARRPDTDSLSTDASRVTER